MAPESFCILIVILNSYGTSKDRYPLDSKEKNNGPLLIMLRHPIVLFLISGKPLNVMKAQGRKNSKEHFPNSKFSRIQHQLYPNSKKSINIKETLSSGYSKGFRLTNFSYSDTSNLFPKATLILNRKFRQKLLRICLKNHTQ